MHRNEIKETKFKSSSNVWKMKEVTIGSKEMMWDNIFDFSFYSISEMRQEIIIYNICN